MKNFLLITFVAATSLVGCMPTTVVLPPLPEVTAYVDMPTVPSDEDLSSAITLLKVPTDKRELNENVTARPHFQIEPNSTVVISVPAEEQANQQRRKQLNAMSQYIPQVKAEQLRSLPQQQEVNNQMAFQTDGYFNKAEQQIEKSLLKKGFIVLDRSKFEAKLRDRRSEKTGTSYGVAKSAAIEDLEERREQNRITQQEYLEGLSNIDSEYQVREENASRNAGENELVDISELIRAAQEGDVRADYLLQVNNFDVKPITDRTIVLSRNPEVSQLIKTNPGLLDAMAVKGMNKVQRPGYFSYMNAKLIEVKTGAIVWVGEHRVESSNTEDINIDLIMKKQVNNRNEISQVINDHNDKLGSLLRDAERQASLVNSKGLTNEQRQRYVKNYGDAVNLLQRANRSGKPDLPKWEFAYNLANPQITPEFPSQHDMQVLDSTVTNLHNNGKDYELEYNRLLRLKNQTENHQAKLVKVVASELLDTIPSKY